MAEPTISKRDAARSHDVIGQAGMCAEERGDRCVMLGTARHCEVCDKFRPRVWFGPVTGWLCGNCMGLGYD